MQIAELKAHVGEETEMTVFLTDAYLTEAKFCSRRMELEVSDRTGSTVFTIWAEALEENTDPMELIGKAVIVTGQIDLWQDRGGVNVVRIREAEEGTYKMRDFFTALSDEDEKYLQSRLDILIDQVKESALRELLSVIFSKSRREKLAEKCGGTNHHAYYGGLLAHLVQTAELSKAAADMFCVAGPYRSKVNADLVIAGALLHDIGKLTTLSDMPGKLSDRGFNLDAATESVLYVTMYNNKLSVKVKDLAPVDQIILACREAKPRTLEAIIVRNADMMSDQVDAYGLAFTKSSAKRGGTLSYSREIGAYLLKGGE